MRTSYLGYLSTMRSNSCAAVSLAGTEMSACLHPASSRPRAKKSTLICYTDSKWCAGGRSVCAGRLGEDPRLCILGQRAHTRIHG